MRKYVLIVTAVCFFILAAGVSSCGGHNTNAQGTQILSSDQAYINHQLAYLQKVEKLPFLKDSGDLRNQNLYYTAQADPNKIWFLVTESMTGQVTGGPYEIRGPVQNVADQVTNPTQQVCKGTVNNGGERNCNELGLGEPNGLYPAPAAGDHFAILVSGGILRWEGWYKTSDQPIQVKTPINININESVAPTATDLSKSQGGSVPSRH